VTVAPRKGLTNRMRKRLFCGSANGRESQGNPISGEEGRRYDFFARLSPPRRLITEGVVLVRRPDCSLVYSV